MDSSNRNSPVKRAVSFQHPPSEHSNPRRQSPHSSGGSEQSQKPTVHKPHRQHVVGAHRAQNRNLSHKSLNKLQRLALTHNLAGEGGESTASTAHKHQRKKSAPVSPSMSPHTGAHVRRNGSNVVLGGQAQNTSMKRNLSTPALKQNAPSNLSKKGHLPSKPADRAKGEQKKVVGFQLADSGDEDEWEDHSSQSNSSTRRSSLAATGKMNGDQESYHPSALTQSPLVQGDRIADPSKSPEQSSALRGPRGQDDVAASILHRPPTSKAPPAISSISATAQQAAGDRAPHKDPSLVNLSSSLTAVNNQSSFTMVNPHGTSSSAEGGVSHFLRNDNQHVGAQSTSNPSAPSSFLPRYNPYSSSYPDAPSRRPGSPTTSRRRPAEPASRTQQKLWLQRTATMSTSPPTPTMVGPRAAMEKEPINQDQVPGHPGPGFGMHDHENRRGVMGGPIGLPGKPTGDNEARRTRKVYEKLASELSVVQRFRSPTTDSFNRLYKLQGTTSRENSSRGRGSQRHGQTNGHIASSSALSRPHSPAASKARDPETGPSQHTSSLQPKRGSQVRFQDQYYLVNAADTDHHGDNTEVDQHRSRYNPAATMPPDGYIREHAESSADPHGSGSYINGLGTSHRRYHANEEEMLLRRMWESREVPVDGD